MKARQSLFGLHSAPLPTEDPEKENGASEEESRKADGDAQRVQVVGKKSKTGAPLESKESQRNPQRSCWNR